MHDYDDMEDYLEEMLEMQDEIYEMELEKETATDQDTEGWIG